MVYKQISADMGQIIRALCAKKRDKKFWRLAAMPDHIHLYVKYRQYSVSEVMGYLKERTV